MVYDVFNNKELHNLQLKLIAYIAVATLIKIEGDKLERKEIQLRSYNIILCSKHIIITYKWRKLK